MKDMAKGKQVSRARRYWLKRKISKLRSQVAELKGHFSMKIQMTQPLPVTLDINAWHNEFDAKALCHLFGVPYEVYQASQTNKV